MHVARGTVAPAKRTADKPLISPFTTEEFDSPPKFLRPETKQHGREALDRPCETQATECTRVQRVRSACLVSMSRLRLGRGPPAPIAIARRITLSQRNPSANARRRTRGNILEG
eukprot:1191786-Prorocentrum_minimum.AAC.3